MGVSPLWLGGRVSGGRKSGIQGEVGSKYSKWGNHKGFLLRLRTFTGGDGEVICQSYWTEAR